MCATSLGGSFDLVTSNDLTLKKCLARVLELASLQSQVPWIIFLPGFRTFIDYFTAEINNVVEDIITRRRADTGPVRKDLLQIILDASVADPVFFPEQRVREEIKQFMCVCTFIVLFASCTFCMSLHSMVSIQPCLPLFDDEFLTGT
jgi:hypothetical protein